MLQSFVLRRLGGALLLVFAGRAVAIGLGDIRGVPVLGRALNVEIPLLGVEKQLPPAQCFSLIRPQGGGELPWLKKGSFVVRKSPLPVLEIRTAAPVLEPILQMAIYLGCGNEVSREYTLIVSPEISGGQVDNPTVISEPERAIAPPDRVALKQADETPRRVRRGVMPPAPAGRPAVAAMPLQVIAPTSVRWSNVAVGEPALRLATSLVFSEAEGRTTEAQRELLRLEYRLLIAMNDQVSAQLSAAEKLRNMEEVLGQLKQSAADFAKRVEEERPLSPATEAIKQETASPPKRAPQLDASPSELPFALSGSSSLLAALCGGVFGLAAWFGWRKYRARREAYQASDFRHSTLPDIPVDPQRSHEREELGGLDLVVEPAVMGMPLQTDLSVDGSGVDAVTSPQPVHLPPVVHDSGLSIAAVSPGEHPEANPVMELADIMLSFGRVKGAAQALQEFIDHNPQEALKPWIRLMEVYRMAGLREEFEEVAQNLNRNFNVEVQKWDEVASSELFVAGELPLESQPVARPQALEDMPRIMGNIAEMWNTADVVGYLYQLLRDNRGGQRIGFALPIVEDILFLIELKETSNRME